MEWLCVAGLMCILLFFFFKQKTAYELRISDWSSDVAVADAGGADLRAQRRPVEAAGLRCVLLQVLAAVVGEQLDRVDRQDALIPQRALEARIRTALDSEIRRGLDRVDRKSKRLNSSH